MKKNYVIDKNALKFIEKYLNSIAPTGEEEEGQKIWVKYITPYVEKVQMDLYGTAVGIINSDSPYRLLIEAHADEISWYVNYIEKNGIIHVSHNGGSDHQITLSKKVSIHTKKGIIDGVFGWPAIHIRKSLEEKYPSVDNIFIDIGADSIEEVLKMGVHVGCIVTYPDQFFVMNKNYFVSKSLDNKIGGFLIAEVAKMLVKNKIDLQFGLYVANSVQEEIGFKGAKIIANTIKPHIAIVTDVTHDTSNSMISKRIEGDILCGSGPVITYSPSIKKDIREMIIDSANNAKIEYQRLVASRSTGTDVDVIAYSGKGVLSALISVPVKYMHTTVEMVHKQDVEKTILLIYEALLRINNNMDKFFV
ncbi:zinc-binding metallopeptidase family protein [Blattabacterium cuenoti]|nr:M42 family peptidase [Blattabacterium cuenoti]